MPCPFEAVRKRPKAESELRSDRVAIQNRQKATVSGDPVGCQKPLAEGLRLDRTEEGTANQRLYLGPCRKGLGTTRSFWPTESGNGYAGYGRLLGLSSECAAVVPAMRLLYLKSHRASVLSSWRPLSRLTSTMEALSPCWIRFWRR
jgi:hypothetical protein